MIMLWILTANERQLALIEKERLVFIRVY